MKNSENVSALTSRAPFLPYKLKPSIATSAAFTAPTELEHNSGLPQLCLLPLENDTRTGAILRLYKNMLKIFLWTIVGLKVFLLGSKLFMWSLMFLMKSDRKPNEFI